LEPATPSSARREQTVDERACAAAFRALFDAELGFVHRVLRRHGVTERDLPDAGQETFLVVHRRLPEFEGRSSVRTWIYGIAVRVAASQRRKAHVRRERLEGGLPEPTPTVEPLALASAEQRQLLLRVEAALAVTSVERREVFVLYELEGLTMREVAEALCVAENTALSRLYRAREDVRAYVERCARAPRAAGGTR
jgi:RNA polymerase sigma-70 factor (ECF subfamily)